MSSLAPAVPLECPARPANIEIVAISPLFLLPCTGRAAQLSCNSSSNYSINHAGAATLQSGSNAVKQQVRYRVRGNSAMQT
jgi:hypothetical protein